MPWAGTSVIVIPDYRGHRIEVTAVAVDGRFNAEVRILRNLPIESKPHAETVTCFKLTTEHPERAGEVWAKRWVDAHGGAR